MSKGNKMSEDILEKQMFEILENKEMPEYIKFAKVDMLVNLGVNINAKDEGETALMKASQNGHKEIVEILLENGADVNVKNRDNWTALMWASWNGYKEIVEILLENGADVNVKNRDNWTALMWASWNGYKEIVEILL